MLQPFGELKTFATIYVLMLISGKSLMGVSIIIYLQGGYRIIFMVVLHTCT